MIFTITLFILAVSFVSGAVWSSYALGRYNGLKEANDVWGKYVTEHKTLMEDFMNDTDKQINAMSKRSDDQYFDAIEELSKGMKIKKGVN